MSAHDDYEYEPAAGPKGRSHWSGIGTLSLLCLVSVLALTLFFAFLTVEPRPNVWGGLFAQKTVGKNGILFAGVTLGMPRLAVETVHPDMVLSRIANGRTVGTFRADGATHTLWFRGPQRGHKVYRMRIERTYEHLGEYEILARFARRHGNPVVTDCGRRVFAAGRQCHYQWLTKGGVPLDVHSRVIKDGNGADRTVLTVVVVDAYLEGKVREEGRVRRHANLTAGR
jgi:hypothetical protein